MTSRERLMASIRGEKVDRPPVSFYELNGLDEDPSDPSPYNIYNDPSWAPLIELTRERTDRIVMRYVNFIVGPDDPLDSLITRTTEEDRGGRTTKTTIRAGGRELTSMQRRDHAVNTVWTTEHLVKDADDLRAWIDLPVREDIGRPDLAPVLEAEHALGETGIVMIDTPDPLGIVADLFDMGEFTILAMTEQELFTAALGKAARTLMKRIDAIAAALPGRLWRVYGPEYAAAPYLPPSLFDAYVTAFDTPIVEAIHRGGGFARLHSHGRLEGILDLIAATGCDALDPIEPPPQGDMSLRDVRERVGAQMTLFGNLEVSDIETLRPEAFEKKVAAALEEGTSGRGRGFVLMPSACPYGRSITPHVLENYRLMVDMVERC